MTKNTTPPASDSLAHVKYRADIDGLRAVAVLSVVGYHAFPGAIRGGFVGVDVFFVISGFLISTILLCSLDGGAFKFRDFYIRRIVRIFPALMAVLIFCCALGWFTLYTDEYKQLGKHVAGGAGFLSNFIYWREAGYFDKATDLKPLLHLWSLGIEEQFYIVWPLSLYFVFMLRKRRNSLLALMLLLATVSFIYNVMNIKTDTTAMFYSPLSRAWELMLGSILSYLALYQKPVLMSDRNIPDAHRRTMMLHRVIQRHGPALRNVLSVSGILLILFAVFALDKTDPFPGALALLPAVGAALLICAGDNAWFNRHILSNRVLVWFGLVSFPLYLWHWPLLSFARIFESGEPQVVMRLTLVVTSIILAWLTYVVIEKPLRYGPYKKQKAVVLFCCIILAAGAGYACYRQDGFGSRSFFKINPYHFEAPETVNSLDGIFQKDCSFQSATANKTYRFICSKDSRDNPKYLLLGDSKARALYPSLVRNSTSNRWMIIEGFPVVTDSEIYRGVWLFQKGGAEVLIDRLARMDEIEVVVITLSVRNLFALSDFAMLSMGELPESPNYRIVYDGLNKGIKRIMALNKKVVLTIDNPTLLDPRVCVPRKSVIPYFNSLFGKTENPACTIDFAQNNRLLEQYQRLIENLKVENPSLVVYDPTPLLCDMDKKECSYQKDGHLLYSYGNHISSFAATLMAKELILLINNINR